MVVKVKEPLSAERKKLRPGQLLFTYLHLAPDLRADERPVASRRDLHRLRDRDLAVRRPAAADADVGGRRAACAAGRRALPGEGRRRPRRAARRRARRAGRRSHHPGRRRLRHACGDHRARHGRQRHASSTVGRKCCAASPLTSAPACAPSSPPARRSPRLVKRADLLIGAVLVPGAAAPKLVTREMVASMKPGAVIVDIAIDQGGCCETSQADHALRSDLRGRRHRALLRRQHAGRGRAHLDLRAQQRDAAVRAGARRQGLEGGACRRTSICAPASTSMRDSVTCKPVAEAHGLEWMAAEAALNTSAMAKAG